MCATFRRITIIISRFRARTKFGWKSPRARANSRSTSRASVTLTSNFILREIRRDVVRRTVRGGEGVRAEIESERRARRELGCTRFYLHNSPKYIRPPLRPPSIFKYNLTSNNISLSDTLPSSFLLSLSHRWGYLLSRVGERERPPPLQRDDRFVRCLIFSPHGLLELTLSLALSRNIYGVSRNFDTRISRNSSFITADKLADNFSPVW